MSTKWARKNGMSVCVYGVETSFEQMVRDMSVQALSKMIEMPLPFEEHVAEWVSITNKVFQVNDEVLSADGVN